MAEVTTIITCMTDAEQPYIREALMSVQRQTTRTAIILCVTDSNSWIQQTLLRCGPGIELLAMPLAPLGEVRNTALARVVTEMVAFLDGDDAWEPTKIERQVSLLKAHDLDVIGSKHLLIREDSKPFFFAFARDFPMPSSWLGRTSVFLDRPFKSVHLGEDVQLWTELERGCKIGVAEAYLLRYRVRRGSLSAKTPSMRRKMVYERRSHRPGGRALLLASSWLANLGIGLQRLRASGDQPAVVRVRG